MIFKWHFKNAYLHFLMEYKHVTEFCILICDSKWWLVNFVTYFTSAVMLIVNNIALVFLSDPYILFHFFVLVQNYFLIISIKKVCLYSLLRVFLFYYQEMMTLIKWFSCIYCDDNMMALLYSVNIKTHID